jgi:hypothetical protein
VANTHGPTKWEKLSEFLKEAYPAMANEVSHCLVLHIL